MHTVWSLQSEFESIQLEENLNGLKISISEREEINKKTDTILNGTGNFEVVEKSENQNSKSIKASSPFTTNFEKITSDTKKQINSNQSGDQTPKNIYYSPAVLEILMDRFMPYCFLWSGFVLRDLSTEEPITRITNGAIEKHFGTLKGRGSYHLDLAPAQYVTSTYKLVSGGVKKFLNYDNQPKTSKLSSI